MNLMPYEVSMYEPIRAICSLRAKLWHCLSRKSFRLLWIGLILCSYTKVIVEIPALQALLKPLRGWYRLLWGWHRLLSSWLGPFPRLAWASEACWELLRGRHGPLVGCTGLLDPSRAHLQLGAAHSEAGASFLEARIESSRLSGATKAGLQPRRLSTRLHKVGFEP